MPRRAAPAARVAAVLAGVVIANAPDLDFAAVLLAPEARASLHRTATHSLLAAAGAGLALAPLLSPLVELSRRRAGLLAFACWLSHLALDLLSPDSRPPAGVQLCWPFSREFVPPLPLLPEVDLTRLLNGDSSGLATGLATELIWIGGLGALLVLGARRRKSVPPG